MTDVITRVGMALDDFINDYDQQPFEIINGERKLRMPNVARHHLVLSRLMAALNVYLAQHKYGMVIQEATFILPDEYNSRWVKGSRTPDILFISTARWNAYTEDPSDWEDKPLMLIPDLVAEVVSPTDRYTDLYAKIKAYLQDGVQLVWVVDPQQRTVTIFTPDAAPRHLDSLDGKAMLTGDELMPGFQIALSDLFAKR